MFNKALFWIFVWFLKTWKKSSPLSEIHFELNTRFSSVSVLFRLNNMEILANFNVNM